MTPRKPAIKQTATVARTAAKTQGKSENAAKSRSARRSKTTAKVVNHASPQRYPPVVYRLHALLHTMQSIEHHEEQVCTLMTEIQRTGVVSVAVRRELRCLLEELPARAYQADLDAVRDAVL